MYSVDLNNTLAVISQCYQDAEQAVRQQIEEKHEAADEEFITRLLHGEFKFALKEATKAGEISNAFKADLTATLGSVIDYSTLEALSADIYADSRLHKRSFEGKTGGDFGILLVRPTIEFTEHSLVIKMSKQGLLCQAKLKHDEKWGKLTRNQYKVLKHRTEFVSLVLYSYSDYQLTLLNPIRWQTAKGATIRRMSNWLKKNSFPKLQTSGEVIQLLGSHEIGTSDQTIINELIAGLDIPVFEITVDWPDGRRPDEETQLVQTQAEHVFVKLQ